MLHNAAARLLPVCERVTFVAPDDKLVFAERCYGLSRLVARSFCFDAGELGYLAPRPLGARKKLGGAPRASSRKVQSLQANTGFYGTELHPTSPSDRAVVQPVSCPIGCVMIQSLPARAGRLYAQFFRELPKAMRQRSIKDYH